MSQIIGVGFLLFVTSGGIPKIFTIRELRDKPQYYKKAGMVSFPLETVEPDDLSHYKTVMRLFDEEMGIPFEQIHIIELVEREFKLIPGRKDVSTFYGYGTYLGDLNQEFIPSDETRDIEFAGWKTIPQLLDCFIRIEVSPILSHLLLNGHYDKLIKYLN
jgi:hypothetical protein